MDNLTIMIEELAFSGCVSLRRCSLSTAYRWTRKCNDYLKANNYEWRVKLIKPENPDSELYSIAIA